MDYKKILKGLVITLISAALTYVVEQIPNVDFGQYTLLVVGAANILVNSIREYLRSKGYQV